MQTQRVALQPAHVLHQRDYRDSSRIVELFCPDHGRLSVVARGVRGARKSAAGRAALLQAFRPLLVSFSGRAEMKTLTAVEAGGPVVTLRGDRLYSALYLNELLVRLLHRHDPHPELYALYIDSLQQLADTEVLDLVLRSFEYQLLEALGYGFDLASDGMIGEPLREDGWYNFHAEHGLVEQRFAQSGVPAFSGADLLALQRQEFSPAVRDTAKRLMREALSGHLGERPLHSRSLFQNALRRSGATPS